MENICSEDHGLTPTNLIELNVESKDIYIFLNHIAKILDVDVPCQPYQARFFLTSLEYKIKHNLYSGNKLSNLRTALKEVL